MARADDPIIPQHQRADRYLTLARAAFRLFDRGEHHGRAEGSAPLELGDPRVIRSHPLFVIVISGHSELNVTVCDGPLTLQRPATKIEN